MKKQREFDYNIIRSNSRVRESVRSLPKGHFQQIRQMFDTQTNSGRKLSTIYERQQKSVPSHVLLRLPVTDDEKLKHTTNIEHDQSLEDRYRDYLAEYQAFRLKITNELNHHKTIYPSKNSLSLPDDNQETFSYAKLDETSRSNKHRQLAMSSAVNYSDSYDSSLSNNLNRTGSSRQYVSSLQHTLTVPAKPVLIITPPVTCNVIKRNPPIVSEEKYPIEQSSRRLHSSTSLSSTGYDSNSSPSFKSKRNSLATNNSNDFIIPSTSSSPLSSSDEQQLSKPWLPYETNLSFYTDEAFVSSSEPSPLISRTPVQLNQTPVTTIIHHGNIRDSVLNDSPSSSIHEPLMGKKSSNNSSYIVQTTSFPDKTSDKPDRKIRRWNNVITERVEILNTPIRTRRYPLTSTGSTGFQMNEQLELKNFTPIFQPKQINEREESPLPIVENPIYNHLPPKKPPRTFENENKKQQKTKINDQKVPSSSSSNSSNSPTFDLGTRSVSCMDLTAGVSTAILSSSLLPLENENKSNSKRSSIILDKKRKSSIQSEHNYEELKTPPSVKSKEKSQQFSFNNTPLQSKKSDTSKPSKSAMKKGVSEPNLAKRSRSKSPFSPRGLIDRFKRILPLTLSKQSLNQNDSDDEETSTSSDNNEHHLRTSRLDHVSRVKNVYDTLNTSNHIPSLFTDPNFHTSINELKTFYEYVVHILPDQELGYFSNGTGCFSQSSQIQQQQSSIYYKYPSNANDEATLKYFCFPDQTDSNNNSLLITKKSFQEYFRFTLTNMHGIRQYGYCSRFFHKGKLNALCIVSPYDLMEIYEKILSTATELFLSYKEDDAKKFLEEIYGYQIPNRGETIHIDTTTIGLYTIKCEFDRRKELIDSITLLSLSTDTIIKIFSSILYEQKIIFIGNELGPLTRLINTFVCLLYPFSWPHTFVPVLPAIMLDIIQAPTPYIIGILRSCESYLSGNDDLISQDNSDILIVDIDHDRVHSINDYLTNTTNENLPLSSHTENRHFQILPKIFKIELKQEISLLRKTKLSLSLDECQERLRHVFMSIFVQSCYNYKDYYYDEYFHREDFLQSKQHTIELFLEWFTQTQLFQLFIRQKFDQNYSYQFAITFDIACEKYSRTLNKQTPQRITAKAVKRKSATRANKQDNRL